MLNFVKDEVVFVPHALYCFELTSKSKEDRLVFIMPLDFPSGASGKELARQCRRQKRHGFDSWVRKIPWSSKQQPTPVFLPGEPQGQKSQESYSPWVHKESDMTKAA